MLLHAHLLYQSRFFPHLIGAHATTFEEHLGNILAMRCLNGSAEDVLRIWIEPFRISHVISKQEGALLALLKITCQGFIRPSLQVSVKKLKPSTAQQHV